MKQQQFWKWTMTALFLLSAALISSNVAASKYGYVLFATGHIIGSILFIKHQDHALFWQNAIFLLVDLWGAYRWFF